jgi:cyclophilin family peptidyl-prolyl cis-trans isomerase
MKAGLRAASLILVVSGLLAATSERPHARPQDKPFFTSAVPADQMRGKHSVVETTAGTFVIDLLPAVAPDHVAYFMKLALEGAYGGTTFHRMVKDGMIQGGDPLSKDPAKRAAYGTGGLGVLKAGPTSEKQTRGAVSTVLVPGQPDSGGAQFFICVVDQPALDGRFTVFGRVVEGMRVVERISETPVDDKGKAAERVEITSVAIRNRPPVPFTVETPVELAAYRAVLETSAGAITVEFFPDKAPEHVRNFLRLAQAGVLDGTAFHRVVRGFVIQAGHLPTRREPLADEQTALVGTLQPEFNDTTHVKGTLSMAHGDDPASASTSFFICTAPAPALDGKYTAFGRVVGGLDVVDAIEATPVAGETPVARVDLVRVRIERRR